ncbi:MAG: aspartate/tyrosine/aromatic aminotransferase [Pirellula sp.]|nr:aspartate/tyrosine/aromatic aminotransferase [Pirellula sp.]
MFEHLPIAPPDSILGLNDAFQKDPRQDKVNLTVGVYKTEDGSTPILATVKKAEIQILNTQSTKSYMPIEGHPGFLSAVVPLVFGDSIDHGRISSAQTPGGTGALRLGADLVGRHFPNTRIWLSNPTWANHGAIFAAAGLKNEVYTYLSSDKTSLDFEGMIQSIEQNGRAGDLICLHACCHNPTGVDPTLAQWKQISELLASKKMIPFVDFAYQGFGDGLEEDTAPLKALLVNHAELFVCSSFSKNFGLYSERVGCLSMVSAEPGQRAAALSQLQLAVRCNYSNPPRHGATIVSRISQMRTQFIEGMKKTGIDRDFSFLASQKGMFSYSGLNAMQADWLKKERGIYIVGTGRLNVAGMAPQTMNNLCTAVADCIKATS